VLDRSLLERCRETVRRHRVTVVNSLSSAWTRREFGNFLAVAFFFHPSSVCGFARPFRRRATAFEASIARVRVDRILSRSIARAPGFRGSARRRVRFARRERTQRRRSSARAEATRGERAGDGSVGQNEKNQNRNLRVVNRQYTHPPGGSGAPASEGRDRGPWVPFSVHEPSLVRFFRRSRLSASDGDAKCAVVHHSFIHHHRFHTRRVASTSRWFTADRHRSARGRLVQTRSRARTAKPCVGDPRATRRRRHTREAPGQRGEC